MTRSRFSVRKMTRIAALSAIAAILYYLPGIPVIPPIYKLDFSTVPVWIAAFALGPLEGVIVALVKDLSGLLHSSSSGIGEIADFLCACALTVSSSLLYRRWKTPALKVAAMVAGIFSMVLVGAAVNYYLMIPFYVNVQGLPLDKIIGMVAKSIPSVNSLPTLIAFATSPFNLLKGVVLALVTWPIYRKLDTILKK